MNAEANKNVNDVCSCCIGKRLEAWQVDNAATRVEAGDIVKKGFSDANGAEHMWVKVTYVDQNGLIYGTLDNYPVVVSVPRFGDEVVLVREEIEDRIPAEVARSWRRRGR